MPWLGAFGIEKHQNPRWLIPRVILYALAAFLMLFFSRLAMVDPFFAAIASCTAIGVYWHICLKVNHRWIGLIAVVMALILYYQYFPMNAPVAPNAALWVLASAFAGVVGSRLTVRKFPEDDQYFLPMATMLGAFALFFVLAAGFDFGIVRDTVSNYIDQSIELLRAELADPQLSRFFEAETREQIETMMGNREILPFLQLMAFLWALGCWVFGGLARRLAAPVQAARRPLMLFQVQHKYIFLLILALILEISRYLWFDGRWPSYLAQPIMAMLAVAFFMQAVGIVLFFSALQYSLGAPQRGFLLSIVGIVSLALMPVAGVLLGLLDVWFDFRRLAKVREQMENQGLHDSKE